MKRMSDAQARFVARIWIGPEYRSCDGDNATAKAVIRNGWLVPTGKTGIHPNFARTPWTGYWPSHAGMAALGAYLKKSFG